MKKVRWVIQNNLIAENDLQAIQKACESMGVAFENVKVIPFSKELPEFTLDDHVNVYYGSTTFMYNIYQQLNKPVGLFFDDKEFTMENYFQKWGKHMLNSDATITSFDEFCKENHADDSLWFVRPNADDKSFDGMVMEFGKIKTWSENIIQYDNVSLSKYTKVVIGPPYNIKKEWRNYIVDGKVVESSLYRQDFKLKKSREDVPADMLKFVEDRCREYTPHKNFAMDVALCGGEYYIIECGCLNSVGFYAADILNIVKSVTETI